MSRVAPLSDQAEFAPLTTERLTLRPFAAGDAAELHRLINDWEVVRGLARLPFPYPRALADEWIASTAKERGAGRAWHLAIASREGGTLAKAETLIGAVGLTIEGTDGTASLGYWVGHRYWGKGIATEAAGRLARWALANLPVGRLRAIVARDNPASAAVLRGIGFRATGTEVASFLARGGNVEVETFEATREDLFGAPDAGADAAAGGTHPLLLVVACALIDSDGRVMLQRRPEGKKLAGLWEFPGGKVAAGEMPEAALIRELREELGIDVSSACLAPFTFASHEYERFHLLMPLYVCRRWRGIPTPREGQRLTWVRPEKLGEYPTPPADKPLIPLLQGLL